MQIEVNRYPQLHALCWNRRENTVLSEDEVFALYERNWRFIDPGTLTDDEASLLRRLEASHGRLLVSTRTHD